MANEINWADPALLSTIQAGTPSANITLTDCQTLRTKWASRGLIVNHYLINAIAPASPGNTTIVTEADIIRCEMENVPLYWQVYFQYPSDNTTDVKLSSLFSMASLKRYDDRIAFLDEWLDFCNMVLPGVDHLQVFVKSPAMQDYVYSVFSANVK